MKSAKSLQTSDSTVRCSKQQFPKLLCRIKPDPDYEKYIYSNDIDLKNFTLIKDQFSV